MTKSIIFAALLLTAACSHSSSSLARPELAPNDHYYRVGAVQAQQDVRYCMDLGREYADTGRSSRYSRAGRGALGGGVLGAGAGALGGTIMKEKVGRSTAAGAAIGSLAGAATGLMGRDENPGGGISYEREVEACLNRLGYRVAGWD